MMGGAMMAGMGWLGILTMLLFWLGVLPVSASSWSPCCCNWLVRACGLRPTMARSGLATA
jgi:hypothetical protein